MPVRIGAKSHNFTEPLGLLSDCHRRIEMFIASLSAIAELGGRPLNDDDHRASRKCAALFPRSHPEAYRRRRTIPVPAPESAALERIRACVFENGDYTQYTPERVLRVMSSR